MNRRDLFKSIYANAAGIMIAGTVSLVLAGPSQAEELWRMYHHQSAPQFTTSLGATKLGKLIEEATGGDVKVQVHMAGTLQIASTDITAAVAQNLVQVGDDLFYTGNVPIGALLRLPFLLQSDEDFTKAAAILQPYVDAEFRKQGVVVLAGYAYPLQYLWGREKLSSLKDLDGAKIRVSSQEQAEFVRRMGASPITMSATEVPSALDRGVVDGLVTGSVGGDLWSDLLGSGFLMGISFNNAYIIMNAGVFDGLSPDMQAKIRGAAEEAAAWNHNTMRDDDIKLLDTELATRMDMFKPTAEEMKFAAETMLPFWNEWAEKNGEDAIAALAEVREALGR